MDVRERPRRDSVFIIRYPQAMTFDLEILLERLAAMTAGDPASRWLVAFSGGMDSTVLLHALAGTRETESTDIVAIYVDHGLQPESRDWDDHCRRIADELGNPAKVVPAARSPSVSATAC